MSAAARRTGAFSAEAPPVDFGQGEAFTQSAAQKLAEMRAIVAKFELAGADSESCAELTAIVTETENALTVSVEAFKETAGKYRARVRSLVDLILGKERVLEGSELADAAREILSGLSPEWKTVMSAIMAAEKPTPQIDMAAFAGAQPEQFGMFPGAGMEVSAFRA